tara:strand:- start:20 stop:679 length:660 start_codon:yes stop_codon:yes gene_type:complete
MSTNYVLEAQLREGFGTSNSRRLRHENQVPAIVYGAGKENESLVLSHDQVMHSLEKDSFHTAIIDLKTKSGSQQVILRDVQMHPHKPMVLHIDFQRIKATEKIHIKIPLRFEGSDNAPGVKIDGGILAHPLTELDVVCLPKNLPEYILVDVSQLKLNESLHLSNISLPTGVELTSSHESDDPTLAIITAPRVSDEGAVESDSDSSTNTSETDGDSGSDE